MISETREKDGTRRHTEAANDGRAITNAQERRNQTDDKGLYLSGSRPAYFKEKFYEDKCYRYVEYVIADCESQMSASAK